MDHRISTSLTYIREINFTLMIEWPTYMLQCIIFYFWQKKNMKQIKNFKINMEVGEIIGGKCSENFSKTYVIFWSIWLQNYCILIFQNRKFLIDIKIIWHFPFGWFNIFFYFRFSVKLWRQNKEIEKIWKFLWKFLI